jgi:hypothetical protein
VLQAAGDGVPGLVVVLAVGQRGAAQFSFYQGAGQLSADDQLAEPASRRAAWNSALLRPSAGEFWTRRSSPSSAAWA